MRRVRQTRRATATRAGARGLPALRHSDCLYWWREEDSDGRPALRPSGRGFRRVPIRSWRIGRTSRFSSSSCLRPTSSASAIPVPELPFVLVEGGGFEPPKAKPADLQSAPVDRLGIPPRHKPRILPHKQGRVNRRAGARIGPPTGPWAGNWSWRQESNPRPADYKSAALPTELRQPGRDAANTASRRNPATPGRPCLPSRGGPKRSRSGLREP